MNEWLPQPGSAPGERIVHYRDTAARLRKIAERAVIVEIGDKLLEIARQYEDLAELVQGMTRAWSA
jgi:hypothetical protein